MDEAVIIQALEQACQGLNLYCQVIFQEDILYVYINRQSEQQLDYDSLTATLQTAIADLNLPEIHGLMLFCRILGDTEPDWQTTVSLIDPIQPEHQLSESLQSDAVLVETQDDTDSLDYDLESSPSEQPVEQSSDPTMGTEPVKTEPVKADELQIAANPDAYDLSQYCFIRNKALITAEVLPPEASVIHLIKAFHALSPDDKQVLLPNLAQLLKTQSLGEISYRSKPITQFVDQIIALSSNEIRKASIWLSRYCYNSDLALSQIGAVLNDTGTQAPVVETADPPVDDSLRQYASHFSPPREERASVYREYATNRKSKPSVPKTNWQLLLIPILWAFATFCFVWYSFQANNGTEAIAQLCKNSKDYPDYCKLAVQLVGTETFEKHIHQTQSSEENIAQMAQQQCALKSALHAGDTLIDLMKNESKQKFELTHLTTAEIYPGLFVVDASLPNVEDPQTTVRTACVFTTMKNKLTERQSAIPLAAEVIPNQWPQAQIQTKPYHFKMADARSVHGLLTLFGTNTLFTAIGLFIAIYFGLGIQIESLMALYGASFIFGIVDILLGFVPIIGYFGIIRFTAVPVVGLIITSLFVKGMKLDLSVGYKILAMAGGILVGTRVLLNWLLFLTIMSLS